MDTKDLIEMKETIAFLVEKMGEGFTRMDERFEKIDQRFDQIDRRFDQIDTRFDRIDKRFDKLENRVDEVETSIHYMHSTLKGIKSDIEIGFAKHDQTEVRITNLEIHAFGASTQVAV